MGKKIGTQRRGKGKGRYTSPSHRYKYDAKYKVEEKAQGTVVRLYNAPSKTGLVMIIRWDDDTMTAMLAPEGITVNDRVNIGAAELEIGNVLRLADIPDRWDDLRHMWLEH